MRYPSLVAVVMPPPSRTGPPEAGAAGSSIGSTVVKDVFPSVFRIACIIGLLLILLSGHFQLAFPAACTIALGTSAMVFARRRTLFPQQVARLSKEAQDFVTFILCFTMAVLGAAVVALWVIVLFYPQYVPKS